MDKKLEYYSLCKDNTFENNCTMHILLTERCNNACYYCYYYNGTIPKRNVDDFSIDMFYRLLDFVDMQEKEENDFSFLGGEPTLNKNLSDFLNIIYKRYDNTPATITTNLIKPLDYYKSLPLWQRLEFTCSYHSDWIKDPAEWFEKAIYLSSKNSLEQVLLMLTDKNIDIITSLYNEYKDVVNLKVFPINEFRLTNKYEQLLKEKKFGKYNSYTEALGDKQPDLKEVQVILSDGTNDKLNHEKYSNFWGMMCNSGFVVNVNGDICYCFSMMHRPIMNLITDKPRKIERWHICSSNFCGCDFEYRKSSIRYFAKNIRKEKIGCLK